MIDISTVGAKVEIEWGGGTVVIDEFSDEGTPFEAPDSDFFEIKKNLNGTAISSLKPVMYQVKVTVIPGSAADIALQEIVKESAMDPDHTPDLVKSKITLIKLSVPRPTGDGEAGGIAVYTWENGRLLNAPTGPSSSAEGRMSSRTYSFEMEKYSGVTA